MTVAAIRRKLKAARAHERKATADYRRGYTPELHTAMLQASNAVLSLEFALRVRRMTPAQRRRHLRAKRDLDRAIRTGHTARPTSGARSLVTMLDNRKGAA